MIKQRLKYYNREILQKSIYNHLVHRGYIEKRKIILPNL